MENCLSRIAEWTCENGLKLNNEKTAFILFTSERQRHKVTSMEIDIDESKFSVADDMKYVGMWLDYSLAMRKQVAAVCSKVSRNIALIRRNRKHLYEVMSKTNFKSGHGVIRLWQCTLLWAAKQRGHKASDTSKLCCKNNFRQE